ncbi:endonuclease/exonuclease/phosphatase family protein [Minwuia thermotolerans]|uniref:Endonuclease/exonuclease/phosphatase domain-containing protein n=1 Tax=Minwuia thermotolerans TaxID=2056226 RepID=A0A2M9G168_9PROT|nr:endonuclease/exonuclease/phosphatase family protein [Minwuia thermotolerans]PJK29460.1 hypothetical protein CVT23_10365 [Minwuia thermotolerans]
MLRIATFNIGLARLRAGGVPLVDAVAHAGRRLPRIVEALSANAPGIDIWLIQEAYHHSVRAALGGVSGFRLHAAAERSADTGLCVLVRRDWPSGGLAVVRFRALDWVETVVARKGAMRIDVETPLGPARVGNLHASYDGRGREGIRRTAPGLRAEEVGQALDLLESGGGGLKLLGGDFNLSLASEPAGHGVATARGWRDLRETADAHDDGGVRTWSLDNPIAVSAPGGPAHDIDLIFMKDAAPSLRVETAHILTEPAVPLPSGRHVPLSDHYALMATLIPA